MRASTINVIFPLRLALLVLLLVGMAVLSPRPAEADSTTYSSSKRTYKVGILLIDSSTDAGAPARGPENPDPYVFHVADGRSDVKPQGWEFINPLAPGVVTPEIRDRWLARDPGNTYQLGQKVQKDMAAYWEVGLTKASVQELLQFDLLFIHNHRPTRFSPQDREKLRKLVDAGGVVWIEDCGNMQIDPANPFFLEEFRFVNAPNGQPVVYEQNHPILNSPYRLTAQEVAQLGDKGYSNAIGSFGAVANRVPNPEVLVNIVGVSSLTDGSGRGLPYLAAGTYGSGAVIVSAADTGCDINDFVGGVNAGSGGNSGAYSGKNLIVAHTEDLKLLYNMVAWGSATNGYRRNNRRTATSFDGVGAPLVSNFDFVNAFTVANRPGDILSSASAPLIVGGVLYVTGVQGGQAWLRAYDLNPFSDADGDGNPDDGVPDLLLGLPYDEIYRVQIGAAAVQPSSPIYGRVQIEQGNRGSGNLPVANIQDRIFVATADGSIRIFPAASPTNVPALLPNGSFNPSPPALGGAGGGGGTYTQPLTGPQAPAPVFFENRLYQVLPNGEVRCLSATDGTLLWRTFNPNQAPTITMEPAGTPTLGFVRQASQSGLAQNSGESTNDLMLYVPTRVTDQNGRVSARMMAYWVGTRNEVQRSWAPGQDGQNGIMNTRVAGGVGGPAAGQYFVAGVGGGQRFFLPPRVRVFSTTVVNGSPVSAKENYAAGIISPDYTVGNPALSATGQVQIVKINAGAPDPRPGVDLMISVDYDVSYVDADLGVPANYASNPTQVGARPNSILTLPQYVGSSLATPALSPEDGLFFSVVQQFDAGAGNQPPPLPSVYSINEQEGDASGSTSKMRWRFTLFNDFTGTAAPADVFVTRQVDNVAVTDTVPIVNYLQFDPIWPRSTAAAKGNTPEALRNIEPVGSPITTNEGVTYVLARAASQVNNRPMSVLLAFKSNPVLSLILPEPFEETAGVTISQTDFNSDPANPGTVTASSNQTIGPNMTLDGAQGRINILNFRAGARSFSGSQSFVVRYTPRGSRQERRVVIPPVPLAVSDPTNLPTDATGKVTLNPGGFTPLLWYYVLPGNPAVNTSPTLAGDFIYWVSFVDGRWHTIGVDADAAAKDPAVRPGFGQQVLNVGIVNAQVNHVRMAQPINPVGLNLAGNIAPPVIAQGQLVVNTSAGSFAYQPGVTLVADSKRLIEAGADGAAIWSLEAALDRRVGGGEEPVYAPNGTILNPPATGTPRVVRTALAKPNTARKIGASDYLIADTGNNRALRVDRAGRILWTLSKLTDPYGILASGESKTLREPTDVQFYTTPTLNNNGTPSGYEIHYLVADAGNNRIIEVADYYNTEGRRIPPPPPYAAGMGATDDDHAVVWVSRTAADGGRQLRFQNIQRFLDVAPASSPHAGLVGYPYISAIVSNSAVGSSGSLNTADFTGGSLVVMSYSPYRTAVPLRNPASGALVGAPQLWQVSAGPNARATEPTGNGNVMFAAEDLRIIAGGNTVTKRINAPTFFQQLNLPTVGGGPQRTLYLICDAEGAYVVEARVVGGVVVRDVLWMFTQQDYNVMNGIVGGALQNFARLSIPGVAVGGPLSGSMLEALPKFQPTSIQLLPNGNYLITNAYTGRSALFESGQFVGEVFEVDPAGFSVLVNAPYGDTRRGGTWASFSVPRLETGSASTNGLNKQVMGNPVSNTGLVEQPLSASRP
jgi:hypothetical protein